MIAPACAQRAGRQTGRPLFATDACDEVRSHAYGRLSKDLLRAKEQASARQHL